MMPENSYRVTLLESKAIQRPDGQVAVVLITKELGPIAVRVEQAGIDALRIGIADAERLLSQGRLGAGEVPRTGRL